MELQTILQPSQNVGWCGGIIKSAGLLFVAIIFFVVGVVVAMPPTRTSKIRYIAKYATKSVALIIIAAVSGVCVCLIVFIIADAVSPEARAAIQFLAFLILLGATVRFGPELWDFPESIPKILLVLIALAGIAYILNYGLDQPSSLLTAGACGAGAFLFSVSLFISELID